jgi:N6-adenosine-specific RNA methylase IME4
MDLDYLPGQLDLGDILPGAERTGPFAELPLGQFACIAADPPWTFKAWSAKGEDRAASQHYDVMTLDGIKALPVAELAAPDCVLFLWVSDPMLPQGLEVMEAWGFSYRTVGFTWAKTTKKSCWTWAPKWHMGLGYYTRANPETCLLGIRGKPKRVSKGVRQLIVAPVREHSRKPAVFFESVEALVEGPYLELFSREPRPNWSTWGRETSRFGNDQRINDKTDAGLCVPDLLGATS